MLPEDGFDGRNALKLRPEALDDPLGQQTFLADVAGRRNEDANGIYGSRPFEGERVILYPIAKSVFITCIVVRRS